MNTIKTFCLLLFIFFANSIYTQDIIGEWRTIDDETGELHNPRIDRNALRHLFSKKAERERQEKEQRETILQLHRHKCQYLCLDPDETPLFPQFPEYFYNPEHGEW